MNIHIHIYIQIHIYMYTMNHFVSTCRKNDHLARHIKDIFSQSNIICVFVDAFIHMYNFLMQSLNSLLT